MGLTPGQAAGQFPQGRRDLILSSIFLMKRKPQEYCHMPADPVLRVILVELSSHTPPLVFSVEL